MRACLCYLTLSYWSSKTAISVYAMTLATLSVQVDAGAAVCSKEHWSMVFRFGSTGCRWSWQKQQIILLCQTEFVIVVCAITTISTTAILFDAISGAGPWYCIACGLFSPFMAKSVSLLYNIRITSFSFVVALSLLLCVVLWTNVGLQRA